MKPKGDKSLSETIVPSPGSLFEAIQCLLKFAHQSLVTAKKTRRLRHVHLFLENAIEKGIVNINLLNIPFETQSKGENNSDGDWFYHRGEGFLKIKSSFLIKTLGNQASFVLVDGAIRILFDTEYPFATNSSSVSRERY
jgi:hypothetical protein